MKSFVTSYRRSRHVQKMDELLLSTEGVENEKDAHKLLGKKVLLPVSAKKKMTGKVVAVHGRKGMVRARFSKGIPGQSIGTECEIQA